jgi:hypothetical protein
MVPARFSTDLAGLRVVITLWGDGDAMMTRVRMYALKRVGAIRSMHPRRTTHHKV